MVLRVFGPRASGLGESAEEVGMRWGELIAMDERLVVIQPLFNLKIVRTVRMMEALPIPPVLVSDRREVSCETNDRLGQLAPSEGGIWWQRQRSPPRYAGSKDKTSGLSIVGVDHLFLVWVVISVCLAVWRVQVWRTARFWPIIASRDSITALYVSMAIVRAVAAIV